MTRTWQRADDEQWASVVELRLALDPRVPDGLPDQVLAEAHEAVTETGRPAADLFGDPDAYARSVTEERVDDAHRAGRDAEGMTPSERLTAYLVTLGVLGVVMGGLTWITDGLWLRPSWSALAAFTAVVLISVLVILALVNRAAGRPAGMWAFAGAVPAVFVAGGAAAGLLPEDRALTLPAPTLIVAGVALIAVSVRSSAFDRWFVPRHQSDDDRWLTHLGALLRTRHALPRREARAHVEEARQHLNSSGTPALDTFGPADLYALHLADGPHRAARLARRKLRATTAFTALLALLSLDNLRTADLSSPMFWLYTVGITYLVAHTARMWLRTSAR
ncbi:hypothetical protein ABZX85_38770 [Streptomyces sp. NPDC004539]|uniref:hypothetical protein n=1 Tax=Streptomyces sp. NPDC004539 TaxID=3154280 RepID=UPI0033BA7154